MYITQLLYVITICFFVQVLDEHMHSKYIYKGHIENQFYNCWITMGVVWTDPDIILYFGLNQYNIY